MDNTNNQTMTKPSHYDGDLWNEDLAPTNAETRTWVWKDYAALWVAMVVCVPTYLLSAGIHMKVALIFIVIVVGFFISSYWSRIQKQQPSDNENRDDDSPA